MYLFVLNDGLLFYSFICVVDLILLSSSESIHCHINSKEIQKQIDGFLW